MGFITVNPATGRQINSYPAMSREQALLLAGKSYQVFLKWRFTGFEQRAGLVNSIASILEDRRENYARLITREMGKPLAASRAEIDKCALLCRFYAEQAESYLAEEHVRTEYAQSFTTYNPLGPVLAVMPWNFPFWQVMRFAVPALMAGNTCLLKHAGNVSGCALEIHKLFEDAGFPEDVFNTLLIGHDLVNELIQDPHVQAVTLTGSTAAGSAVAAQAGRMLKKTVLELGGSDAYIVLEDADIPEAAKTCASGRLMNNGQSCIAAKRLIIVREVMHEFMEHFLREMKQVCYSDPMQEDCLLGPMARDDLRSELHSQVQRSIKAGACLEIGGFIPDEPGFWYPPTVISQVVPGMAAFDEELFGPAAAVICAEDELEAVELANNSIYGLGSAVFTSDIERGIRIASTRLEAGSCFVNTKVQSDPRLPFGGIKQSGYGRELSYPGIREFVNIKTVCVK